MKPVWLSSKEKEDLATTFTRSLGPSTTVEQVREYISSGGDLLVPSKHGWKPLHSACKANCSLEVVTFILDSITNSGTVQEKNCDGSMRSIAADTISYKTGTFPSFDDITYCGVTPLHCLAEGGNNVEVAKLLLQRGANLEAWSVPVLRRAISGYKAQSWEEQLAHYSCQPGGKPLMYVDEKPQTPLSIACTHSRFELVEFFVQQGASKTIRGEKISFTMVDLIRSYSGVISQRNAERLEWILDNTKPNPLGTSVNVFIFSFIELTFCVGFSVQFYSNKPSDSSTATFY